MKIPVIYADGTPGAVRKDELDGLLQKRRLLSFRRSSKWVGLGVDPIRSKSLMDAYNSKERREK